MESGSGAFVGFRLTGQNLRAGGSHIIPFYGHTFNKDTWVPNADVSYFHIGEDVGYFPSESWTSSYLGHDDNFGPNFCIPRLYMESKNVDYVVELFRPGVSYGGTEAEAFAVNILYSVLESVDRTKNKWIFRLFQWADKRQVVFRAQAMSSSEYGSHLKSLTDWEGNTENLNGCQLIEEEIPKFVWVVEISTPHLFPANERKIGEVVLDATQSISLQNEVTAFDLFVMARLPEYIL